MQTASVFLNNRSQAVRIPAAVRFNDNIKKVNIRMLGNERIISPINNTWDSFFLSDETVDDDFCAERETPNQPERESLD